MNAVATAATAEKTSSVDVASAAAPSTGPPIAPAMPMPSAVPMTWPRRSRGVAAMSQARPAAHEAAPPTPCKKRAAASSSYSRA